MGSYIRIVFGNRIYRYYESTCTLTWGDQAENHVGMEKIGEPATEGFTIDDLKEIRQTFMGAGVKCEYYTLNKMLGVDAGQAEEAAILIIRGGFNVMIGEDRASDLFYRELKMLDWDKKAKMWGKVKNKTARYNLCFSDYDQEPDYEEGKGRIVSFESIDMLQKARDCLSSFFGYKAEGLQCEGNYYYDVKKCYIGAHGDSERRKVIGMRFGHEMNLCYQWYINGEMVGPKKEFIIYGGDIYVMSERAVGRDWKTRTRDYYTLRHSVDPWVINV
jgi:hypothetical protein